MFEVSFVNGIKYFTTSVQEQKNKFLSLWLYEL